MSLIGKLHLGGRKLRVTVESCKNVGGSSKLVDLKLKSSPDAIEQQIPNTAVLLCITTSILDSRPGYHQLFWQLILCNLWSFLIRFRVSLSSCV